MKDGIVIFGASSGGRKVAETFESFGIAYECFLDNDTKKWDTEFHGKKIYSPNILMEGDYGIVIASEHQEEIEKQLEKMGQLSHLMLKEDLIIPYVEEMLQSFAKQAEAKKELPLGKSKKILIDLVEGVQLGGIETWTYTVARELMKMGIDTEIFAKRTNMQPPEDIRSCFYYFDIKYSDFKKNIYTLAGEIVKRSPCAVIINKHTQILYAAYLAQRVVGKENLTILSVIHNDVNTLYRRQQKIDSMTDIVCCVSDRIRKRLIQESGINPTKVFYKESPVYISHMSDFERDYTESGNKPVKIGYAARLTKFQKRADLFPKFIEELEKRKINYDLSIVGDGAYREIIERYLVACHLEDRVSVLGKMKHEEVMHFWKEQDIFVSFSDFEGSSISAIEAMSQGAVPVETDVSGVREFVQDGVNGYVVPLEGLAEIADHIKYLEENRDSLRAMGMKSRQVIIDKCSPKEYGRYIIELCGGE